MIAVYYKISVVYFFKLTFVKLTFRNRQIFLKHKELKQLTMPCTKSSSWKVDPKTHIVKLFIDKKIIFVEIC